MIISTANLQKNFELCNIHEEKEKLALKYTIIWFFHLVTVKK